MRGQRANAIASGLAILPLGDLAKLSKIHNHHIIPKAVYRKADDAIKNVMKLNAENNIKKLSAGFHGNHPQYSNYVNGRLNNMRINNNINSGSIQSLQMELNSMIDKAYDNYKTTGQNLNDYFRQFNGN